MNTNVKDAQRLERMDFTLLNHSETIVLLLWSLLAALTSTLKEVTHVSWFQFCFLCNRLSAVVKMMFLFKTNLNVF